MPTVAEAAMEVVVVEEEEEEEIAMMNPVVAGAAAIMMRCDVSGRSSHIPCSSQLYFVILINAHFNYIFL